MNRGFFLYLFLATMVICFPYRLGAQMSGALTHYSAEEGLSQNAIMDILQDRNGMMWFATWDGINRFDGYRFEHYKTSPDSLPGLSNNRIEQLKEDVAGRIWVKSYDNRVYRLDKNKKNLLPIPYIDQLGKEQKVSNMVATPDSSVWLLADKGAVKICWNEDTEQLNRLVGLEQKVYEVCVDSLNNEWILSETGVYHYQAAKQKLVLFTDQPMMAATFIKGALWMSDGKWLYQVDINTNKQQKDLLPETIQVVGMNVMDAENLLIVSKNHGILRYNIRLREWNSISLPLKGEIRGVYIDRKKRMWVDQHQPGVVTCLALHTGKANVVRMQVDTSSNEDSYPRFRVIEDRLEQLWIHPYGGGLGRWDEAESRLVPLNEIEGITNAELSNKLHAAYSDRQGNLWISTHSKGLEKISFDNHREITILPLAPDSKGLLDNEVRAICQLDNGDIWVGTKNGKIHVFNEQYEYCGYLNEQGRIVKQGTPLYGVAYCIKQDSKQNLWIATKGEGLMRLTKKDATSWRIRHYKHDPENPNSLCHNYVYSILEDREGGIWVATYGGGIAMMDPETENFISCRNGLENYPLARCSKARHLSMDGRGRIWIATTAGVLRMECQGKDWSNAHFEHYYSNASQHSLTANDVHWIEHTPQGETYIATFGGGLNFMEQSDDNAATAKFERLGIDEGVASDILLAICPDKWGNLWMATENGISHFNIRMRHIRNYNRLAPRLRMTEAAICMDKQGNMLMGTSEGIMRFRPERMRKSLYTPPMIWTELSVGNRKLKTDSCQTLHLNHNENNIHLKYVALDYLNPYAVQYAYRLKGWDDAWNYVGNSRTVTYTNLPPGEYVLEVRSTNSDGMWAFNNRELTLIVARHPWRTPWAYAAYALLLLALMIGTIIAFTAIYRLKHRVMMEHRMSEMKLKFFTDISHELRTPLTLIAAPLENVLQNKQLDASVQNQLQMVNKNTERMLRLVNQILDLRKLQHGKMELNLQPIDLIPFLKEIMQYFQMEANDREIDFWINTENQHITLWADDDKLEKIIYNLLSNAFKFTPDGKTIGIEISEDEQLVTIAVKDQGIGIASERRTAIFERFENQNILGQTGTGIGLSLVKELVDLHGATIEVTSKLNHGSCFILKMRKKPEMIAAQVKAVSEEIQEERQTSINEQQELTMLIVEDNVELRGFLRTIFQDDFQLVMASDGEQGWHKAAQILPDVILADVMMPKKDGMELTKLIRQHPDTSHIPVILLTAKTDMESKLQGMEYGADDYITKPFSTLYLKAKVNNLLERRKKMYAHLVDQGNVVETSSANEESPKMTTYDSKFLEHLKAFIEQHMDDSELVVDDLVQEMAVSRSVLFKKMKSLTGLAPVEFIREMRINRAKQLIDSGEYSITQVAYMVGINDPRYFSKCFKQQVGMTPSEYRDTICR